MIRIDALAAMLAIAICTPAWPQAAQPTAPVPGDAVVLRAGDFTLTRAEYEKLVPGFDRTSGAPITGATAQALLSGQEVARLLALVSEAQRRKIDQAAEMQALIRVRGYVLLANALLQTLTDEVKKDEAGTRALWNSEKNSYVDVVARQILIRHKDVKAEGSQVKAGTRTEAQARALATAIYQKLKSGADFASLAKTNSDDEATRTKGGQLPAFSRGAMQAEFESVAFSLPAGSVSEPFKTKYGYHVIQVDERRPFPFERVRASLEFTRAKQKLAEIAASGVQLNDAYFKP